MKTKKLLAVLLALLLPIVAMVPSASAASEPAALQGFGAFVETAMADWHVPGMAVAVIQNGDVIYQKGFGLRDMEQNLPVTPDTQFAVASVTKAFAALAFQTLAEEGKLDWDAPVRQYIPGFRLQDPLASEQLTARDLATHRTGLHQMNVPFLFNPDLDPDAFIASLEHLPMKHGFRSKYEYNNLGYVILGELLERASGKSWDQVVTERILQPLGMDNTSFSVQAMQQSADYAVPYALRGDRYERIPFADAGAAGAAGAMNTSLNDMVKWVKLQLSGGQAGGAQVVSPAGLMETQSPQVARTGRPMELGAYGLGWYVELYRGQYHVYHGGRTPGFGAVVSLLPQAGIGVIVLANDDASPAIEVVSYGALDRMLGLDPIDLSAELKAYLAAHSAVTAAPAAAGQKQDTQPSHPLKDYAGTYAHPLYGNLLIQQTERGLGATYYSTAFDLDHFHYDQFQGILSDSVPLPVRITFVTNDAGEIDRLQVDLDGQGNVVTFTRRPNSQLSDPAFLSKLAGRYNLQGEVVVVTQQETRLTMTLPGQHPYTLVPEHGLRFHLQEMPAVSVEFAMAADGSRAAGLVIIQSGFRFEAGRME